MANDEKNRRRRRARARPPDAKRALIEELEPRVLLSTLTLDGAALDAALQDAIAAEQQLIDESAALAETTAGASETPPDLGASADSAADSAQPDDTAQPNPIATDADGGSTDSAAAANSEPLALPLAFEENLSQQDPTVDFSARGSGFSVALGDAHAALAFESETTGHALRLELVGGSPAGAVSGEQLLTSESDSQVGDGSQWRSDLERFGAVRYADVYDGIDVRYSGNQRQLACDFAVAAGADASQIRLRFEGADSVAIDAASGDLRIGLGGSSGRISRPLAHQVSAAGTREVVESAFVIHADGSIGLALGPYDAARELAVASGLDWTALLASEQAAPAMPRRELVILDPGVQNSAALRDLLASQQEAGRQLELFVLDANRDGIEQIADILASRRDLDAVHLLSHGTAEGLQLGNTWLDGETIGGHTEAIRGWQTALGDDADLLLYGCDLAASDAGRSLVDRLSQWTGADVAASSDLTGAFYLGGDWDLEYRTGRIEAAVAASLEVQRDWVGLMSVSVDAVSTGTTTGTSLTISHATSGTNRLMLVGVSMRETGTESVSSVTYNGVALTFRGFVKGPTGARVEIWSLVAPATGTHNVVVNLSGAGGGTTAGVMTFTGVDQATALGIFASASGDAASGAASVGSAPGELVFGVIAVKDADQNLIPGAGQTERWDLFTGSEANGGASTEAGAASVDLSWTWGATTDWAIGAVSIKPAAFVANVAADQDTYLKLKSPTLNYGTATSLVIDRETTDLQRALLDFDLSAIPADATITSATLTMQSTQIGGSITIGVYEMLQAWTEGSANGSGDAANWTQSAPGTNWASAGGDFNATPVASITTNATGQHSWNLTTLVQAWVSGSKVNNGLMVASPDGGGNRTVTYDSSEGTTPPVLVISYTVPANTAPVLDASKSPSLASIAEDAPAPVGAAGTLVSSLVDFASPAGQVDNVTDADGGAQLGIAVMAADAANGTWWYSTNDGGSWTALGTVSASSARLLAADAGTRLYFQPNANYNGTLSSAITFRGWDRTSGANGTLADTSVSGGTTAFSTASETASLVISAVNDAPVNTVPGPQATPINASLAFSGANTISVADVDASASPLQVTLTATNGKVTMASIVGLSFSSGDGTNDAGMTFQGTLSNINAALAGLSFSPTPSYSGAASVQITTNDLAGRTVGNSSVLGSTSAPGAFDKEQIATQVSVSSGGTLTSVTAFLINNKTNDVHYGIYSDVAGEPGTLLAQASASVPKDLVGSWYTLELPSTSLTAGTYWVALDVGKEGAYSFNATGGNTRFSNYDPKTGFSSPSWTGTYASNTQAISAYLAFTTTGDSPLTDTDTINITVGANTAPVLSGANALTAINEDPASNTGTLVSALLAGHVTDPDANSLSGIAVTGVNNSNGNWEYTTDAGGTWTPLGTPTANAARLLAANPSSYVRFVPSANWNGTVASGLTFRAWDQTNGTPGGTADTTLNGGNTAFSINTATSSITVNPVNDAPTLGSGTLAAVNEDTVSPAGQTVSAIFTGQFADIDAGSSLGGIAVVGNTADAGTQGIWQYSTNAGGNWFAIGAVSDGATALAVSSSTLIRFVPAANYNGTPPALVVRGLDNSYASGFSTTAGSETRVSVDTTTSGGTTAIAAATANLSTSITPVNDAPVLTGANNLGPINEDSPDWGMFVSALLTGHVTDPDSGAVAGIAVTAVDNSNGTWQYTTDGAFSWNDFGSPSTSAARLLGTDPNSGVRFVPNPNWNGTVSNGLTFRAWDQTSGTPGGTADTTINGGSSAFSASTAASSITVSAVNDAPVNSVPGAQSTLEDTALVFSSGNGNRISISDVDAGAASVNVALSVTSGSLTLSGTSGLSFISGDGSADALMNFTGSIASINAALNGLTFTPSPDFRGGVTLQLVTGDIGNTGGGALADSDTVSITVDAVNDAPVITSDGGGASASLSVAENTTLVTTVGASDVDLPAQTLTYAIVGGADQARFTIDGATGALRFSQAPNFEAPADANADNVYHVTVRVSDGAGGTDSQAIAVTVTDVADGIRVTPTSVGPIGGEIRVNTTTGDAQLINPNVAQAIASDANGNFVVVWASNLQDGALYGIYAQRFSADGTAQGAEFLVNTTSADNQINPVVAIDDAGNFVVGWASNLQDGSGYGVYAQRYSAGGVAQGSEFLVNTTTSGSQGGPAIAIAPSGAFVIAWTGSGQDPDASSGVFAQRFDATGVAQGGEFRVNTYTSATQQLPSAAMDAAGNFVVSWISDGQDGSAYGVYGQRFDAGGVALGSEFRINTTTADSQLYHDVVMLADGRFFVAFQSRSGADFEVYLQRYAADGTALGGETQVNTTTVTGHQPIPSISADPSGNLMVVWNSSADGAGAGVIGRRLDASGAPLGGEFQVNATSAGNQSYPEVVAQPGGGFLVAWGGNGPGDADGVFLQRFGLATTEAGGIATFQVVLEAAPTADVTITLTNGDPSEGTLSTNTLTFTTANWNVAQSVTVTGVDDGLDDGDVVYRIMTNAATSADASFNGLDAADVALTNLDDDEPPLLDLDANDSSGAGGADFVATWTEDAGSVALVDADATLTDAGGTTLISLAVQITNLLDGPSELLLADVSGTSITATYSAATGVLSLTGVDTIAHYQQVLRTIAYDNSSNAPDTTARVISFQAFDPSLASNLATTTLTMVAVNDAPVASDDSAALNEGGATTIDLAANDSDADNGLDLTSIQIVSGPANGSVVVNADGTVSYTHDGSETAADAFTYTIRDASGAISNVATVTLTVNAVNDAPVASNDSATLNEGAGSTIDLAANDSDADNALDLTSIQIVSGPANGSVVVNGDGTVSYTHDGSETTADAFTYTIRDASGAISNVATVTLTVNPVNDAPVASDDSATLNEGSSTAIDLAANDSDADNALDLASIQIVSGPASGSVVVNADGTVTYTHNGSETAADAFTYTIRDVSGTISNVATVTLTVSAVNDAPVASDDSATLNEGASSTIDLAANDSDADNGLDLASIQIVSGPANGSVVVNGDGTVSYTHDGSETAADAFTYTIRDASGAISNVATVTLTVNPVNDAPVASDDSATLSEGASSAIDLAANDSDADNALDLSSIQIVSGPANGSVVVNGDGTVSYTHNGSETTADAFTYTIRDVSGAISNVATVTLTVNPVNDAPVASGDSATLNEGASSAIDLAANDSDADNALDLTSIQIVSGPASGSVVVNGDGTVSYTHDGSETTADAFTYTIRDASGAISNVATVTLTVNPVNDAPIANADAGTANEGGATTIDLAANDSDADSALDLASIQIVSGPASGSVVVNADGTVTYTHDGSETAADAFTYTIRDGSGAISNVATVTLTVNSVNDAPVANADSGTVNEGGATTIDLAANDSDADNALDLTSIQIVSGPANGSVVVNADGTVSYTHNGSETAADSFTYTIRDISGAISNVATVTLTVNSVNDAPIAAGDSAALNEGASSTIDLAANDSDADNALDLTSIQIVSGPVSGSVLVNADGTVSYTHDGSETAADAFTYTIRDASGAVSNVATVTLTVNPVNDAPVASDDSAALNEGASSTIDLAANDTDADNALDLTSIQIASGPATGSVVINGDGTVTYTHNGSETVADAFTYTIRDASGAISNVATVTLTVNPVNDAPVANADAGTANEGGATTIDLAANDTDADNALDLTSIQIVSGPASGSVLVNADGTITYTHNGSETTADSFTYTIRDLGGAVSNVATVTLIVNPVNDAPLITSDGGSSSAALNVAENSISVTQVSAVDVDVPAQALSYSIVGGADASWFTIDASTGELSFATAPDYEAPGDFDADNVYDVIVQASDGALADTQALAITVTDVGSTLVVTTSADTNDAGIVMGNAAHTSEWLAVNRGADGLVSLREAIIATNNTANAGSADVITFDISGGGPHTIVLGSALPALTEAVLIDASSEPDFSPGTAAIVLDGSLAGLGTSGLVLGSGSGGSTLRGLAIHGFDGSGIVVQSAGNLLDANFIGTDATGTIALGNAASGVFLSGADNRVIGNVIAGNALDGVVISGPTATNNVLWSNWIGVDDTGAVLLGNGQSGVLIDQGASNNSIGGIGAGEGNLIAGHGGSGIVIAATSSDRNALLGNLIWSNAQLGIDLGDDGRSANDALDADSGANQGQNFPVLSAATSDGAGSIVIAGDLDSAPGMTYRVEFFANAVGDSGNHGEAERYLGFVNVTTDASGHAAFAASLSAMVGVGEVVTATATDSAGNTSEFGLNRVVGAPAPSLDLDADDSSGVGGTSYQTIWTEGAGAVSVADSDLAINDLDSATLVGATVAITNPNDGALESLTASTTGTSITASYDAGAGVLTLSGVDTLANYELVLRSVAYDNASNAPDPAVRVVQISVNDGSSWSNTATADVAMLATNDAPLAGDDAGSANEGGAATLDLAANDSDADDALDLSSLQIVSGPANGAIVVNGDGTVTYTHDGSETVADAFSYTIRDASGALSSVATVTLVVNPMNDAPLASDDAGTANEGGATTIDLAANDSDADDALDLASIQIVSGPANGSVVVNGDGTVSYTHDGSETVADAFSYTIRDAGGAVSRIATVALTVSPVNDAPMLLANTLAITRGGALVLSGGALAASDAETPANALTFTVSGVTHGSFERVDAPGVAIASFTQAQLAAGQIRFVHDGTNSTPTYSVLVDDGTRTVGPFAAAITLDLGTWRSDPGEVPGDVGTPSDDSGSGPGGSDSSGDDGEAPDAGDGVSDPSSLSSGSGTERPGIAHFVSRASGVHQAKLVEVVRRAELDLARLPEADRRVVELMHTTAIRAHAALWASLDRVRSEMAERGREATELADWRVNAVELVGLALSSGFLLTMLRSSSLWAAALSSLPLWRRLDPLVVLAINEDQRRRLRAELRRASAEEDRRRVGRVLDAHDEETNGGPERDAVPEPEPTH